MSHETKRPRKSLPAGIAKVLKRLHYPLDVILLCVRWYVAYSLSLGSAIPPSPMRSSIV
jgi:amino acid transporter